jgi:hypothetical protein
MTTPNEPLLTFEEIDQDTRTLERELGHLLAEMRWDRATSESRQHAVNLLPLLFSEEGPGCTSAQGTPPTPTTSEKG